MNLFTVITLVALTFVLASADQSCFRFGDDMVQCTDEHGKIETIWTYN